MTGRRAVLLIIVAVVGTTALLKWPEATAKPPRPEKVVVTKTVEVTPEECQDFVSYADAFVSVTGDFLAVQNRAIDAVLEFDADKLKGATRRMTRLQGRFDMVTDQYSATRAGCL